MVGARWLAAAALALLTEGILAQAAPQPNVVVRAAGRGRPGAILQETLAKPFQLVVPDSVARLPRDSTIDRTVLILGGDATVASTVHGDVIVVDGDLFLHPGAVIDGRAIAIGGGVYPSSLARVAFGTESFRDVTFDITRVSGDRFELRWRVISPLPSETLTFPIVAGFRLPGYTRVDGLGLPWGPRFMFDTGRIVIDPLITYRSDIGELDPSLVARVGLGGLTSLEVRAGRGTFTNDDWIQSDIANLLSTLGTGHDYRNYWRADRAEALVQRRWERASTLLALEVGARTERAWSIAAGGPWSVFGRDDVDDGILRPNPSVTHGRITSALAGARIDWDRQDVALSASLLMENAIDAPNDGRFTQSTFDVRVGFPTVRSQSFWLQARAVHTFGDRPPPQRFAYIGGGGTLRTFEVLEFGGDRLLFFESRYAIPIQRIRIPIGGSPVLILRHMIGMAGVDSLAAFEQNLAMRVQLGPLRVDWAIEPISRDAKLSAGLSLAR